MRRVNLDTVADEVQQFFRGLDIDGGVELELEGKIVCEVVPPHALSPAEKMSLIARGRELARRARERNKGVPARVIAEEVRKAVEEVRSRKPDHVCPFGNG